jgi:hypothetical protein
MSSISNESPASSSGKKSGATGKYHARCKYDTSRTKIAG